MYEIMIRNRAGFQTLCMTNEVVTVGTDAGCRVRIADDPQVKERHVELCINTADITINPLAGGVTIRARGNAGRGTRIRFCEQLEIGETSLCIRLVSTSEALDVWEAPPPPPTWRDRLADDSVEHDLLAELRARPDDAAARMVFSDWLEGRGRAAAAALVQGAATDPTGTTPEWRSVAACAVISECTDCACPGRWQALTATADERVRTCATCRDGVHYCTTSREVTGAIARHERIVIDAAIDGLVHEDRIHDVLTRLRPEGWRLDRSAHRTTDAGWTIYQPANDMVLESGFVVLFARNRLVVRFGGNDAGIWSPQDPPRYSTTALFVTGLDDNAIAAWLTAAFANPPSRWGYT